MQLGSRREFILRAAVLWQAARLRAQELHHVSQAHTSQPGKAYRFTFFDENEKATLRVLLERFVPADERSSGAVGARVDEYIDFVVSHGEAALQATWRHGLEQYRQSMDGRNVTDVDLFLERQARREFDPQHDDEVFFVVLKAAITEGFYTSEVGINEELRYQGMTYMLDFVGCQHQAHHPPTDWRPLLQQPKEA